MIKATRNQLGNVKNPYQGGAKRVLCVCSAGLLRSPTLANLLHTEFGHNTRAAGSNEAFALIPVSEALIHWADEIVFVNSENFQECLFHNDALEEIIREKAIVLSVEDNFPYGDAVLQSILFDQYREVVK